MRQVTFKKLNSETWEARPFRGWRYRIIRRWLKGYTIYFQDEFLGNGARLNEMKQIAREHLEANYIVALSKVTK